MINLPTLRRIRRSLFWLLAISCLLLEWGSSSRVGLLPRPLSWLPDLLLAAIFTFCVVRLVLRQDRLILRGPVAPLAAILLVGLISAVVNQADPLNTLFGLWQYFRFWGWFLVLLIWCDDLDWERDLRLPLVGLAFLQIPLTVLQGPVLGLHPDLVSGSVAGTQRLALMQLVIFTVWVCLAVLVRARPWLALAGFLMFLPGFLGESKALFYLAPVWSCLLMLGLRLTRQVSTRFGLAFSLASILVVLAGLPLYPDTAREYITGSFSTPGQLVTSQDRISKSAVQIPEQAYQDPEWMKRVAKGKPLGRTAAIRFAHESLPQLAAGGHWLGAGPGATAEGFMSFMNGRLTERFPTFDLSRSLLTVLYLELGWAGLLAFAWLGVDLAWRSLRRIRAGGAANLQTGLVGLAILGALAVSLVYTQALLSQSLMFVLGSLLAWTEAA